MGDESETEPGRADDDRDAKASAVARVTPMAPRWPWWRAWSMLALAAAWILALPMKLARWAESAHLSVEGVRHGSAGPTLFITAALAALLLPLAGTQRSRGRSLYLPPLIALAPLVVGLAFALATTAYEVDWQAADTIGMRVLMGSRWFANAIEPVVAGACYSLGLLAVAMLGGVLRDGRSSPSVAILLACAGIIAAFLLPLPGAAYAISAASTADAASRPAILEEGALRLRVLLPMLALLGGAVFASLHARDALRAAGERPRRGLALVLGVALVLPLWVIGTWSVTVARLDAWVPTETPEIVLPIVDRWSLSEHDFVDGWEAHFRVTADGDIRAISDPGDEVPRVEIDARLPAERFAWALSRIPSSTSARILCATEDYGAAWVPGFLAIFGMRRPYLAAEDRTCGTLHVFPADEGRPALIARSVPDEEYDEQGWELFRPDGTRVPASSYDQLCEVAPAHGRADLCRILVDVDAETTQELTKAFAEVMEWFQHPRVGVMAP